MDEPFDVEYFRQRLQVVIAGVQLTIEQTSEDETRTRMKSVLKALQQIVHALNTPKTV